jgi:hypothetical protein
MVMPSKYAPSGDPFFSAVTACVLERVSPISDVLFSNYHCCWCVLLLQFIKAQPNHKLEGRSTGFQAAGHLDCPWLFFSDLYPRTVCRAFDALIFVTDPIQLDIVLQQFWNTILQRQLNLVSSF